MSNAQASYYGDVFGIGGTGDVGWGDSDSWGAPQGGVDLTAHAGIKTNVFNRVSEDHYLALIILVALGLLWLFGGVIFKSARI